MDNSSLALILGTGAAINAYYDSQNKKSMAEPILGTFALFIILSVVGGISKQWGFVNAMAGLYLLYSFLVHGKSIMTNVSGWVTSYNGSAPTQASGGGGGGVAYHAESSTNAPFTNSNPQTQTTA